MNQKIKLRFAVGELRIFNLSLKGKRLEPNIFKETYSGIVGSCFKEMKFGINNFLVYSCPVPNDMKIININRGTILYLSNRFKHYFLNCDQDFQAYIDKRFSKKTISTLRRKENKIAKSCKNNFFRVFSSPDDMDIFFKDALPIAEKSYQQKLFGEGLPSSEHYRQKCKTLAGQGKAIGFMLYVDDTPAAYTLCPVEDGTMLYHYTGFDKDYDTYSPGTVLQKKIIEYAMASSDIERYDLCTGEGSHKTFFTEDFIPCGNLYISRLRPAALFLYSLHYLWTAAYGASRAILDRVGMHKTLKKTVRALAQKC